MSTSLKQCSCSPLSPSGNPWILWTRPRRLCSCFSRTRNPFMISSTCQDSGGSYMNGSPSPAVFPGGTERVLFRGDSCALQMCACTHETSRFIWSAPAWRAISRPARKMASMGTRHDLSISGNPQNKLLIKEWSFLHKNWLCFCLSLLTSYFSY